jgi:hypothetical protein
VLRPRAEPSELRLSHLGLTRDDFAAGIDPSELGPRWAGFVGAGDWVAAWNPRTLAHFERTVGAPLSGIGLKGVYGRLRGKDVELDQTSTLDPGLPLPAALEAALETVRGRARRRLSAALACALGLQRLSAA